MCETCDLDIFKAYVDREFCESVKGHVCMRDILLQDYDRATAEACPEQRSEAQNRILPILKRVKDITQLQPLEKIEYKPPMCNNGHGLKLAQFEPGLQTTCKSC